MSVYVALFNIDQSAVHLLPLPLEYVGRVRMFNSRYTHTYGRRPMDNIPSNNLITLRSTKQLRLFKYLPEGNDLAPRSRVLHCFTRPHISGSFTLGILT